MFAFALTQTDLLFPQFPDACLAAGLLSYTYYGCCAMPSFLEAVSQLSARDVGTPYGYVPETWIGILFISLYGVSTAVHFVQSFWYQLWWALPTIVLAGLIELVGWSGRLWSSYNVGDIQPFQMQITGTILAPTPLLAGNFIILGIIIRKLGPVYSRIPANWYSIIFCTFDIIALVVQGLGGGIASSEAAQNKSAALGGNVMLGGIIFQMAAMTVYALSSAEFFFRYFKDIPVKHRAGASKSTDDVRTGAYYRGEADKKVKIMIGALSFNTLCLFIRAIYRTIELADGWSGRIITTEVYFNVLDGAMVVLAIYTLNFAHPGLLLGSRKQLKQDEQRIQQATLTSSSSSLTHEKRHNKGNASVTVENV